MAGALLILSRPSGAVAQRIGPRIPLTAGAVLTGAGLLLMTQIHPGDSYVAAVLRATPGSLPPSTTHSPASAR